MHLTTSLVLAVLGASTALALPLNEADNNVRILRREAGSDAQAVNLQRREPKRAAYTGAGGPGYGLHPDQAADGHLLNGSTRMYRRGWRHHRFGGGGGGGGDDAQKRDLSDESMLERRGKHGGRGGRGRGGGKHRFGGGGGMGQGMDGGDAQSDAQRRSLGEEVAPPAAPHVLESKEATTISSHDSVPPVTDSAHSAEAEEGEHKKKSRHRKSGKHRGAKKHLSKHRDEETSTDDAPAEHEHGHRHRKSKAHKHRHNKSGRKHKHHDEDGGVSDDESVGHHRKSRKHRHRKQRLQTHENSEGVEHAEKVEHTVHEHPEHEDAEHEHEVKHKSKHSAKHRSHKHKKVHPDDAQVDAVAAPPSSFEPPSQVVQQRGLQIDELD